MMKAQNLENMSLPLFRKKILLSLVLPAIFIVVLWLIRFVESGFGIDLVHLGIYPHEVRGIPGILFSPFIHGNARHLLNNSLPLLLLGSALFYFYSDVAVRVIIVIWIATGALVWFGGRPAWHIGASGIIYGLASFLFVSGIIRRYIRLMALSMLVVFIYGSMVWGMFPFVSVEISWESHMLGAVTGLILAIWYRDAGPVIPVPDWMENDEDEGESEDLLTYEAEAESNDTEREHHNI
jgi:membrane associated rhomboid family serine protease